MARFKWRKDTVGLRKRASELGRGGKIILVEDDNLFLLVDLPRSLMDREGSIVKMIMACLRSRVCLYLDSRTDQNDTFYENTCFHSVGG